MTFPLAWCVASTSTSAIWTCFGAEAADKIGPVLFDSIHKRTDREESISDNDIGDLQQILLVTLDDRYVMLHESHVAQFQLSCRWSLMGAQHHATVGIDVDRGRGQDLESMVHGTGTTGPESADMRSLLTRLADVARIDGYGQ